MLVCVTAMTAIGILYPVLMVTTCKLYDYWLGNVLSGTDVLKCANSGIGFPIYFFVCFLRHYIPASETKDYYYANSDESNDHMVKMW